MGLTFLRSMRMGAVRFNFSGSGIGMSVGIPGLRIGSGPRGAYISGGMGGFRYRKSLNAPTRSAVTLPASQSGSASTPGPTISDPNIVATVVHETKNVLELHDSDSDELLHSMNEQRAKIPWWPFVAIALFFLYLPLSAQAVLWGWPAEFRLVLMAVFATGIGWVYWRDKMRKLTVLFFEPDQATSDKFAALSTAANAAAAARKLKAIATTSRYADPKYSAGAGQGLKFSSASFFLGQGPGVVANVAVPVLKAGRTTLAFYPDRILAFQGTKVGAIPYARLQVATEQVRFIEAESVPSDARVIDRTWQYVNKNGGPDRRFKSNRQLPICAYAQLNLSTPDGLDVRFLGSRENGFDSLAASTRNYV
jgi:hypothetical protein